MKYCLRAKAKLEHLDELKPLNRLIDSFKYKFEITSWLCNQHLEVVKFTQVIERLVPGTDLKANVVNVYIARKVMSLLTREDWW